MPGCRYRLGDEVHDLTHRTLVMGILNRTPTRSTTTALTYEFDALLRRAEVLVDQGADLLDVGGVKAGPGPEVGEAEELDRVVAPIAALHERFDVADLVRHVAGRACSTRRARPARSSATTSAASAIPTTSASRPSTARRSSPPTSALQPRVPDPGAALRRPGRRRDRVPARPRPRGPRRPASHPNRSRSTPVSTSGRRRRRARCLLRESDALASHGYTLLLSASNKRFLGDLLDLDIDERRAASLATVAYGVAHGCRIVRVHDVEGSVAVCRMVEAIAEASVSVVRVYLVKGSDPSLRDRVVDDLVAELLGGDDRSLALEEITIPGPCRCGRRGRRARRSRRPSTPRRRGAQRRGSPPFMTEHRVVVVRDVGALTAADVDGDRPLPRRSARHDDPRVRRPVAAPCRPRSPRSSRRSRPRSARPESEKTDKVSSRPQHARRASCSTPTPRSLISAHLGDDAGRVAAFVEVLLAAYGPDLRLGADDVVAVPR